MMKFEYWQSKRNGMWFWHLLDSNNEIVADGSEGYNNEVDLLSEVNQIRSMASIAYVEKKVNG